jgi:hypothetical protein
MSFIPIQIKNAPILVKYLPDKYPNATNFIHSEIKNGNTDIICHYTGKKLTISKLQKYSYDKKFYKKVFSEFAKEEAVYSDDGLPFFVINDARDNAKNSKIIGTLLSGGIETEYGMNGHMYYDAYSYDYKDDYGDSTATYYFKCTEI